MEESQPQVIEEQKPNIGSRIAKAATLGGSIKVNKDNMYLYAMTGQGLSPKERDRLYLGSKRIPPKLTEVEAGVWREVKANGDYDTFSHIAADLRELGYPQVEVRAALLSLLKKGYIRRSGETFEGEEVYELP